MEKAHYYVKSNNMEKSHCYVKSNKTALEMDNAKGIADVDRHVAINWIWSLKNENQGIWLFHWSLYPPLVIANIVLK